MPSTPPLMAQDAGGDPPSPPSPSASFYDVSDDEENDYSTIRHSKSSRGVKLLAAKSKVYAHPSQSARDNVAGYVVLVQQKPVPSAPSSPEPQRASSSSERDSSEKHSLLLGWTPESGVGEDSQTYTKVEFADSIASGKQPPLVPPIPIVTRMSSVGTSSYVVPLAHIYSLLVRPPSPGWWHGSIIINTRAGESFPPMFFHDSECQSTIQQRKKLQRESFDISANGAGMFWGGDELLRWLRAYVNLERSTHEPSVYLVDPSEQDRVGFGSGGKPTPEKVRNVLEGKHKDDGAAGAPKNGLEPVMKALTQARWNFLEKMSQVTTFTRRTAQAVAENRNLPPQVRKLMQNPQVQNVSDEFDSARLYLARWAMGIAEQSEKERSQRIWTARDILELEDGELGQFEVLNAEAMSLADKRKPVTLTEWNGFFNSRTGRLEKTPDEVKERIFHGGLDENARKEAWLFLLGVYDWQSSKEERRAKMNSLRDEYIRLKGSWWERMVDEEGTLEEREWWKEQRNRIGKDRVPMNRSDGLTADAEADRAIHGAIEKDVHRTDRHLPLFAGEDIPHPDPDSPFAEVGTNVHLEQMKDMLLTYNELNRDLGYVQGMSDLLAPIYAIEQDDAVAFWGFASFMERMERNFLRDQSGMRLQLLTLDQLCQFLDPRLYEHLQKLDSTNFFFFFRMLLVWFKREFEFPAILHLWETLWTDYLSSNYHLFIAMAILDKHRNVIIDHLKGFDEVLKYVNELSGTIDLPSTLIRAETLFRKFQRMVEAIDKKSNFPSAPTLRQRAPLPRATVTRPGTDGRPRTDSRSSSMTHTPTGQGVSNPASPGPLSPPNRRRSSAAASSTNAGASSSGRDLTVADHIAAGIGMEKERVITPELRSLLSREVPKLEKKEVREHGGGVGS